VYEIKEWKNNHVLEYTKHNNMHQQWVSGPFLY